MPLTARVEITDENEDIGDKRQERTIIWEASDTASRPADKE
ncbi:hypothetical protein I315_05450 [Cryptococcus gattii Ru294]|uniref:Uncharacterized protein n=2 Tax=Cryptococcus gattii TaxID=37769 RepID=E6R8Q6_CRYGW|nr:Hypothetical Protein CGB_F6220C [Cryptococcus gattii WM276]KIR52157.1 hypothetical protein I315_05450 [Cryptococcus gattii Ru294]KIR82435.1 hypothetical protein I306_00456 [Cryptococcus gattii EJB2]KIY30811.1 hypothetical protein I305_06807 [Cryptococcus gattii E566]KJE00860.1 hypothetical protein I311_05490 [Cryptococcus gattii NT-10]ADV23206.1 Hypothetical Protein CGB_F6220C [Cryptococcus gattii WM276]